MDRPFEHFLIAALGAIAVYLALSCSSNDEKFSASDGDQEFESDVENNDDSGFPYHEFYMDLRQGATDLPMDDNGWADDFGDAAYYGLAFFVNVGYEEEIRSYIEIADQAKERNLNVIRQANSDFIYFLDNLEEVLMAELGLIEYASVTADNSFIDDIDTLLDKTNDTIESFGTYLDIELDTYALKTYGPTTITAVVALVNLRYAQLLDNERATERILYAREIISVVDEIAYNGSYYNFNTNSEDLFLYPNIMMTIANSLAFMLGGEEEYLDRCLSVCDAIQAMRDENKLCFRSPYSAEHMGAETEDYSTLSSQNYTIMALAMMYQITQEEKYKQQIVEVVSFIHDYLYQDGKLLHHWMDGRIAAPTDPEYYCSGCNLQFLYAIWYVEHHIYGH